MAWKQRLKSGNWRGLYRLPDGSVRSAGTFPHEETALHEARYAEKEAAKPGWRDPRAGLRTWGDWCLEWQKSRHVAPGTAKRDESPIRNHLMPQWGKVALVDITRHDVKAWAAQLRDRDGLGESSVYRYVSIFAGSLAAAVDAEIITVNPAFRLKLPNGEKDKVRYFTREQVDSFIENTEGERDKALIALLAGCGLRWGEATGILGRRIDLQRGMLRVAEVWDTRTKSVKAYPKGRSIRDVPIPGWVKERITPFAHEAGLEGRVFPVAPALFWKRVWNPLQTGGRVHDLRHTYASWLLQAGVPIAEVSRLMGHSSITITERYAHLAPPKYDAVLAALQ